MVFYLEQTLKVQEKIEFVLRIIRQVERIPSKFLKLIDGAEGLYEIRVEYGSNIFRIFCCNDEGNLVILFNGFQKKTQKTPYREIEKVLKLKREYFKQKKLKNEKAGFKKYRNI